MTPKLTRPQAVALAREMWADGEGWGITQIRRYLAARGVNAARSTIHCWVDHEWREARLIHKREVKRRHREASVLDEAQRFVAAARRETPDVLLALRVEDKLTYPAIAAVARRFLGEVMTPEQARARLYELGVEKNPNKVRLATVDNPMRRAA